MAQKIKKVYISGAISDCDYEETQAKFSKAEEQIRAFGHIPINPLKNGLRFDDPWSTHMVKDIETLFDCDAVYVLPDHEKSKGARIELFIAKEQNLEIINQLDF